MHKHDASRVRFSFAVGFDEHAFHVREGLAERDVGILVGRIARNMRLMRCEHVDVDVERLALVLMLGSHGKTDAAAHQIGTNALQAVCMVDNRFFDGLGMRNTLEGNVDWDAHGLAPVGLDTDVEIHVFILDRTISCTLTRINPMGTASSLYGQAMDGFSFVMRAGLHVDNGATRESNFHEYKWGRMFDSPPEMSCHILPTSNVNPAGIGELGIPAASGAAANAWARATGKQPRNFPLNEYGA